jgi:pantoate--beta-alanine ligase
VREPDGLALSSRNVYLSAQERRTAPNLARVLRSVAAALAIKPGAVARELARGVRELGEAGFEIDYLEIREEETLRPVTVSVAARSRVLAAVWLGKTRLIDNMPIG